MSKSSANLPLQTGFVDQILEHSPNLVFVRDRSGQYLTVSRSYCHLFETPAEMFVGRSPQQVFGEELGQRLQGSDQHVFDACAPLEFDVEITIRGERRAYRTLKFPLLDERGLAYAVCGVGTDVTARKRHEEALNGAALAVSGAQGETLFGELVRFLTTALDVDGAFITLCSTEDNGKARTLSVFADGKFEENVEYSLPGTVCGTVVGKGFRMIPSGIREIYPDDGMFARLEVESYAAYPLVDSQGHSLGLIAALSRRPMLDERLAESMLRIFAVRAENEIERLRTEQELRRSEESYRAIFDASEDAILIHDWDTGAIMDANPKACAAYGCTLEEMRNLPLAQLSCCVAPFLPEDMVHRMQEAKAGRPQRFEWQRQNKDGSLHWDEVHLKSAVIGGKPRVLAFTREITGRKTAEQALRDAALAVSTAHGDDVFRQLARSLSIIVQTDFAFIASTRNGDVSTLSMLAFYGDDEFLPVFDYPIQGTPCETVVGQTYRVYPSNLRVHFPADADFARQDMESYAGFPLNDPQGHPLGIISVACRRPITNPEMVEAILKIFATRASAEIERRRAEQDLRASEAQLRQAQKMEAIGQLTGGIAHDFNNILTSILGYLMLASEHQDEHFEDETLARYLEEAHGSAQRARDLIQQMLTFSRGQRGAPRAFVMTSSVNEGLKMLRATLPATVEISSRLQPEVSPVMLDPVHLGQVLLNLCINARDAVGSAGKISVKVAELALAGEVCASCRKPVTGQFVALSVRDSGPGIAPEVQERMFEPFFTTKDVGKGTGMGLATVHGIVHEHGGHILVDSVPGKGARFRTVFPALARVNGTLGKSADNSPERRGRLNLKGRVLVVDDERAVGAFMRDLLQSWGLDVLVEFNPLRAADLIRSKQFPFDLVITDQAMPKMTGIDLARHIRDSAPGTPVLLYTGYGNDLSEADLQEAGIRAVIRKPIDSQQLFTLLQQHLSRPATQSVIGMNM